MRLMGWELSGFRFRIHLLIQWAEEIFNGGSGVGLHRGAADAWWLFPGRGGSGRFEMIPWRETVAISCFPSVSLRSTDG